MSKNPKEQAQPVAQEKPVAAAGEVVVENTTAHDIDLHFKDENGQVQRVTVEACKFEGNNPVPAVKGTATISQKLLEVMKSSPAIAAYFDEGQLVVA